MLDLPPELKQLEELTVDQLAVLHRTAKGHTPAKIASQPPRIVQQLLTVKGTRFSERHVRKLLKEIRAKLQIKRTAIAVKRYEKYGEILASGVLFEAGKAELFKSKKSGLRADTSFYSSTFAH
jgi:hypothetical protein